MPCHAKNAQGDHNADAKRRCERPPLIVSNCLFCIVWKKAAERLWTPVQYPHDIVATVSRNSQCIDIIAVLHLYMVVFL